jgi:hypothetical protein
VRCKCSVRACEVCGLKSLGKVKVPTPGTQLRGGVGDRERERGREGGGNGREEWRGERRKVKRDRLCKIQVLCNLVQSIVQYSTVQYSKVQYSTEQ